MFMQGSSLFLFFLFLRSIFEKIFSAYFRYQKGTGRGLLSRARTFSGRTVPEMLAVGEEGIYRFLSQTQEPSKSTGTSENEHGCGVRGTQQTRRDPA